MNRNERNKRRKEMKVSSIGERALISRLSEIFKLPDGMEKSRKRY